MLDPYLPMIAETLKKYPRVRSSRLFEMARQRGYSGSQDHLRHAVSRLRPLLVQGNKQTMVLLYPMAWGDFDGDGTDDMAMIAVNGVLDLAQRLCV
jgi:hypothetical protein